MLEITEQNNHENVINMLDIQRLSTEDGPGLRTTLFTKGCPLKCAWCHNPESISPKRQRVWIDTHCMGCQLCVKACKANALQMTNTGLIKDAALCADCGACADICPTGAIEVKGDKKSVDELCYELLKDRAYFEESGGGITISGGDPLMQAEDTAKLFAALQAQGVQTALDTTLFTSKEKLDLVLPHVDLLLLDIKIFDNVRHEQWTGVSNIRILENARYIAQRMRKGENPTRLWIRTPIIPGATDTVENIKAIAQFVTAELGDIFERWELCAFNNLCKDKYTRLGLDWTFADATLMRTTQMDELLAAAKATFASSVSSASLDASADSEKISWTGAVQMED
ncbi:MAG: glycyl-radical enzyme activating protein [Clostridiales Family XIII bacterium]|jgi:pyruvate formate lyase activating enzyme|nr:glycyl-radical enzyme activating protein [Clostridiales Family XIII bacterium]